MNRRVAASLMLLAALAAVRVLLGAQMGTSGESRGEMRIAREVRHEIVMLPFLDVFDFIAFEVHGSTVKLTGAVTQPVLKSQIEKVVKGIEGVEKIENHIDVLPPSPSDDAIRLRLFRAIYGYPALVKYALGVIKPIRIIVKNGQVTLEGVVDNEADKNMVNLRANGVSGIFSVTNHLKVVKP